MMIMSENNRLAPFARQEYLNLETFRKTGTGVQTPVWFVEDNGKLFVRTVANSGKVKRLRRSPRVRIAPCTSSGGLKGEWVEAEARELADSSAGKRINGLMNRKYGLFKRFFDLMGMVRKLEMTSIEITPRG
jgi:uncharacterized protein